MKTVVHVYLGPVEGRPTCADDPFLVIAPQPGRSGVYDHEPEVIAQLAPDEREAKFEAEWISGEWKFGRRFLDS